MTLIESVAKLPTRTGKRKWVPIGNPLCQPSQERYQGTLCQCGPDLSKHGVEMLGTVLTQPRKSYQRTERTGPDGLPSV